MKDSFLLLWRWVRWPLGVGLFLYAALVGYNLYMLVDKDNIAEDVAIIHANRLTWEDVNGDLPVEPNAAENAKLEGVDSNKNGIRDDVERSIYLKYKATPTAVAMLQYAKELQMEFTHVYNSETLVAVIQEQARGSLCIGDSDSIIREVERLVFNSEAREQERQNIYKKYMTSYSLPNPDEACDLSV